MATDPSPAIRIYRRASARFGPLREALARADFHPVIPPDALAEWECTDDAGTRVRCAGTVVLVEAGGEDAAAAFDARFRMAFPSDRDVPDGGAAPMRVASIAGSDESGKGDRSQRLAVAAVLVPCVREAEALARGVRDSKTCSAPEIAELARWIRREFVHEIVVVEPAAREGALRSHGGNESRLLTAMHAECLTALLVREEFAIARVDRFAPGRPVAAEVGRRWPEVLVDECARGERHVAVAAASVVARCLARVSLGAKHVP
jgi:ribonuclease HIII